MFDTTLPREEVSRIIRQTAHDIRNHVNSLELELLCLTEESDDPVVAEAVARMQRQTAQMEGSVRTLSSGLRVAEPETLAAADLFEQWRSQHRRVQDSVSVDWGNGESAAMINTDPAVALSLLRGMLLMLAEVTGGTLEAGVREVDGAVVFTVTAPGGGVPVGGPAWDAHLLAADRCPATLAVTPDGSILTLAFPSAPES